MRDPLPTKTWATKLWSSWNWSPSWCLYQFQKRSRSRTGWGCAMRGPHPRTRSLLHRGTGGRYGLAKRLFKLLSTQVFALPMYPPHSPQDSSMPCSHPSSFPPSDHSNTAHTATFAATRASSSTSSRANILRAWNVGSSEGLSLLTLRLLSTLEKTTARTGEDDVLISNAGTRGCRQASLEEAGQQVVR